jgi:hypothetical protein
MERHLHVGWHAYRNPGVYVKHTLPGDQVYDLHYDNLRPASLYIKIGDDIVFISHTAIEHLVRRTEG